jgi:hypothetical protein
MMLQIDDVVGTAVRELVVNQRSFILPWEVKMGIGFFHSRGRGGI